VSVYCREEINKSYKHMAVLLHPDKNLAPGSDEAFKCIAKAREELLRTK
jgi:DnaJ family protein C protein 27